ncbi:adenylate/guanylate cyclase domain-containing protein [Ruegeria arenilitoris]|uniref:adenylate/guanylate cyclase domain-containing protein n=1 Tax=Ruegeria arenilitoris TaxID=1173585 RepID=UPI00147C2A97|nr:adenylate/guanylate cyclase domain-containing protein [Ruegeria arenilitoris]
MSQKDAESLIDRESDARLVQAEQQGLRIALICRSAVTGAAFVWYVLATFLFPEITPRFLTILVLLGFTALGVAHLSVIGTAYDRRWIKFAIYGLDVLAICAAFALVPISRAADIPQIIAFRAYGIYYLFPILAASCLSLSWQLVLWTGGMIIFGWWVAFAWVVGQMDSFLSWSDMPSSATRADYESVFLSIDFVGRGNRIEETGMVFFATLALAAAVYRARSVFFAQVAADMERQREKSLRERVSDLLGKHVPETIAKRLIEDDAPLRPHRSRGTALVMDITDFTSFSAQHEPEHVIKDLDEMLSDATRILSSNGGMVLSYLGDGLLATFNAPAPVDQPEISALHASKELVSTARKYGFEVRVGIATGDLVTGIIGNETRQSFTVYGDAVNLASRFEGLGKELNAAIVLDQATQNAARASFKLKPLGEFQVRGFEQNVAAYSLEIDA